MATNYDDPQVANVDTISASKWNAFVAAFKAHKARHATGADDALTAADVGAASASHAHAATDVTSGSLDGDRLAAPTTTKRGGVKETGVVSGTKYYRDDDTWATPPGGGGAGDVIGPATSADNTVTRFDGADNKTVQGSLVTIDDNGSMNIPSGQSFKINGTALAPGDVGAAASSHAHAGSDISSGSIDGDRLPAVSTTKRAGVPAAPSPSGKFLKDDDTWATPAGGGAVATDAIWDAAGDLAVGSGENTAARLPKGTTLQILHMKADASMVEWVSQLLLAAGSASAGTAPIKLTAGTLNTAPEAGAIEFDGSDFYISI